MRRKARAKIARQKYEEQKTKRFPLCSLQLAIAQAGNLTSLGITLLRELSERLHRTCQTSKLLIRNGLLQT
jgi:hypothetical protein